MTAKQITQLAKKCAPFVKVSGQMPACAADMLALVGPHLSEAEVNIILDLPTGGVDDTGYKRLFTNDGYVVFCEGVASFIEHG